MVKPSPETTSPKITSPEEFFGYRLGSDRKIARWDKIAEYFYKLESLSDAIKVVDMGPSTEGNSFLLTIISSPENLANLEHYREINGKIADPRNLTEEAVKALVKEGKAVVCQSMSLHATEIGGTQMAPELAYDLLAGDCDDNKRILENVIFLMVPCFNPDGQIMVTDWYNKYLGTEYEGSGTPFLYHKYAGHDNNRDAFALNLPESRYIAKLLYTDWHPQAYQDHHHMGSTGARLFLAPYSDAIRPYADPLVWREDSWFGAHMAYTLEEQGKTGILNGAQYPGWGHFGFHWITTHHNIAGMLTESASARLATPLYIHPHQLRGASKKTMPKYEAQTNFPHPWPGGWWRLRDIVEQQKIAAWALLDICAKYKEKVLWNAYLKAVRQTERGAEGTPYAYAISPCENNDPLTADKLVELLLAQGAEVKVAKEDFLVDGRVFPEGTYVITMDQPKMGVLRFLLGRTFYPDSYWTRNPDGSPIMYDTATDTIGEFMGVDVAPIESKFCAELEVITEVSKCRPEVKEAAGYLLDPRLNDSYLAVNRLLKQGAKVWRLEEPVGVGYDSAHDATCSEASNEGCREDGDSGCCDDVNQARRADCEEACCEDDDCGRIPAGAFYVESAAGLAETMRGLASEFGVPFIPANEVPDVSKREVKNLRVGMYQRYWGGNMDEGWTRYVLDKFEVPYVTLMDADIKGGNLGEKVDVLVIPGDRTRLIAGPDNVPETNPKAWPLPELPPEYRSGLGKEGQKAVAEFVRAGGRLVAMDTSSDWAIEACELKVRNIVANATWKDFYCNGSTLHVKVNPADPLAYGMPAQALVLNQGSPTFEVTEMTKPEDYRIVAEYPAADILQSGWVLGGEKLLGKPCMVAAKCGEGEVILIGFRTQFRAQAHGTFKFLFNCLL